MRNETHNLQLSLQRYTGDDLSSIQFKDLEELEQQLEHSIKKVRARKVLLISFLYLIFQTYSFIINLIN